MLTLELLESTAIEVIGEPIHISRGQSAIDIPGWDSLNNTLIALELSNSLGIELNGWDMGQCKTFGELIDFVNILLNR